MGTLEFQLVSPSKVTAYRQQGGQVYRTVGVVCNERLNGADARPPKRGVVAALIAHRTVRSDIRGVDSSEVLCPNPSQQRASDTPRSGLAPSSLTTAAV